MWRFRLLWPVAGFASLSLMLTVSAEILPRTDLTYLAFRGAFLETLERIVLSRQVSLCGDWVFGYLTEVPFLQQVAPQVQLDLLLNTWQRHLSETEHEATLLDEAVVHAACETASRLALNDRECLKRFATTGPAPWTTRINGTLARKLAKLPQQLSRNADFLLLTQFLDLPPRESKTLQAEFGLRPKDCEPLFDALGRWTVGPDLERRAAELLTDMEAQMAATILAPYMPRVACL